MREVAREREMIACDFSQLWYDGGPLFQTSLSSDFGKWWSSLRLSRIDEISDENYSRSTAFTNILADNRWKKVSQVME